MLPTDNVGRMACWGLLQPTMESSKAVSQNLILQVHRGCWSKDAAVLHCPAGIQSLRATPWSLKSGTQHASIRSPTSMKSRLSDLGCLYNSAHNFLACPMVSTSWSTLTSSKRSMFRSLRECMWSISGQQISSILYFLVLFLTQLNHANVWHWLKRGFEVFALKACKRTDRNIHIQETTWCGLTLWCDGTLFNTQANSMPMSTHWPSCCGMIYSWRKSVRAKPARAKPAWCNTSRSSSIHLCVHKLMSASSKFKMQGTAVVAMSQFLPLESLSVNTERGKAWEQIQPWQISCQSLQVMLGRLRPVVKVLRRKTGCPTGFKSTTDSFLFWQACGDFWACIRNGPSLLAAYVSSISLQRL